MIERVLGLPAAASAHAAELDLILALVHVLMAVILAGWGAFFVFTLVRFRRGRNPVASHAGLRGRGTVWTEAAIVAAEIVLLAGFSIPAWATRVSRIPTEHEATVVRVVAEQFAWNVHYPGPDGAFGSTDIGLIDAGNPLGLVRGSLHVADDVRTVNELVVPVGRPVIVQLTAKDVIHSFGVPAMRVKQDAIPGMTVPVWFVPSRTGAFEIACSQLCGLGHYRMRAVVRVVSGDEYVKWLSEQSL